MDAQKRPLSATDIDPTLGGAEPAVAFDTADHHSDDLATDFSAAVPASRANLQPSIIRAETNGLRFPIFAIGTKGLKGIDGYEAIGSSNDGGNSTEYVYRVTRNTDDVYPGDLARRIHNALLAKLELQGFPYSDTVSFTWRELARLVGVQWKGAKATQFKAAIKSIHGLRIWSNFALKQKTSYCDIVSREEVTAVEPLAEREQGFSLYTDVVFQDQTLADGSRSNVNKVVFSGWLITNLNSFYYAKLDRSLWLELDKVGPLASRLYEYLLFSKSGDWRKLRIRYAKLCTFLPVKVMDREAKAKTQFGRAIDALVEHGVIQRVAWSKSPTRELIIEFFYGDRVRTTKTAGSELVADDDGFEVRELRSDRSPQSELISAFYNEWTKNPHHRPYQKELDYGREVIALYGIEKALELIPHVAKVLRVEFPDAKTFNATERYWEDALKLAEKAEAAERAKRRALIEQQKEERKRERDQKRFEKHKAAYLALSDDERRSYEEKLQASMPANQYRIIRKMPNLVQSHCVQLFAKENGLK